MGKISDSILQQKDTTRNSQGCQYQEVKLTWRVRVRALVLVLTPALLLLDFLKLSQVLALHWARLPALQWVQSMQLQVSIVLAAHRQLQLQKA